MNLAKRTRYFTIKAPRQTGKSTYFRMLAKELETIGYQVLHINVENFKSASEKSLLQFLANQFKRRLNIRLTSPSPNFPRFYDQLLEILDRKIVFILLLVRIVSVSSMAAAISLPIVILIMNRFMNYSISNELLYFSIFAGALIVYTHRSNIKLLIKGEEKPFKRIV